MSSILNFGKYRGIRLSEVPDDYLRWLANPILKNGETANVPRSIVEKAKTIVEAAEDCRRAMCGDWNSSTVYVIERDGDIGGMTIHNSLDQALSWLSDEEYPIQPDCNGEIKRSTPDPEDDRILIWEVLSTGHRKVVWHFSGWHWPVDEYGEQGTLPGDEHSLYSIAMRDIESW